MSQNEQIKRTRGRPKRWDPNLGPVTTQGHRFPEKIHEWIKENKDKLEEMARQ